MRQVLLIIDVHNDFFKGKVFQNKADTFTINGTQLPIIQTN